MTPRTASLRVAHKRTCANASRTAPESAGKGSGCTCKPGPSYYVAWRDRGGATRKSPRVTNKTEAEKVLRSKQVEIDQGRVGTAPERNTSFPEWAEEYERIIAGRNLRNSTRGAYAVTLQIAREAIGYVTVREIGPADLRRFHKATSHTSEATQIKHLTQLGACLSAAVDEGYATRNPITAFRKSLRLRAPSGTPAFTDGELERLIGQLQNEAPVYRLIARAAAATGARVGELIALDWRNVDLTERKVHVRHTYSPDNGLTEPKDRDSRTVYLTDEGEQVFADVAAEYGVKESGLVFTAPRSGDYVNDDYLRKVIVKAMKDAGIPTTDATSGRPRKPLHSLRATFARQMLEQGRHPQWVEAQLGHSDLRLTLHVYGAWSDDAMRAEAIRVERS